MSMFVISHRGLTNRSPKHSQPCFKSTDLFMFLLDLYYLFSKVLTSLGAVEKALTHEQVLFVLRISDSFVLIRPRVGKLWPIVLRDHFVRLSSRKRFAHSRFWRRVAQFRGAMTYYLGHWTQFSFIALHQLAERSPFLADTKFISQYSYSYRQSCSLQRGVTSSFPHGIGSLAQ